MERSWTQLRERDGASASGAGAEGQVPMSSSTRSAAVSFDDATTKSWLARGVRVVRNALVAVAVMTLVPIALVVARGDRLAGELAGSNMNVRTRLAAVEPMRAFRAPVDPSITPMQAGVAMNALRFHPDATAGFVTTLPSMPVTLPWRTNRIEPGMFTVARPIPQYEGIPSEQLVLESTRVFSPRELAYLRAIAEAPVWRNFDLVARAPAVDVIGGQFRIPFDARALPEQRALPPLRDSRELAYAAVSRAAYYLAIGQPRDAEFALQSIVSVGFAYIDNGTSSVDALVGAIIINTGRDALEDLYMIEQDPRASQLAKVFSYAGPGRVARETDYQPMPAEEARRRLLARLEDPGAPRPERFESIRALSMLSCSNVRDLMVGPRAEVRDAITRARRTLARFPSEEALIDLETRLPSAVPGTPAGAFGSLVTSAATAPGIILGNPRLAACTRVLSGLTGGL